MSRSDRHRGRSSRDDRPAHTTSSSHTRSGRSGKREHHSATHDRHTRHDDNRKESTGVVSRHAARQRRAPAQQSDLPKIASRLASTNAPPRTPADFLCHICSSNHWTVLCPQLALNPATYPLMDANRGCWRCGRRGHNAIVCTIKKYKCRECGGLHDTKDCAYDHVGEDWHEFVDARTRHPFYTNADESEVQWTRPTHELDVVLWYCPQCALMIPDKFGACVKCHAERPSLRCARDGVVDSDSEADESGGEGEASVSSSRSSVASRSVPRPSATQSLDSDDEEEEESEESLPLR